MEPSMAFDILVGRLYAAERKLGMKQMPKDEKIALDVLSEFIDKNYRGDRPKINIELYESEARTIMRALIRYEESVVSEKEATMANYLWERISEENKKRLKEATCEKDRKVFR